MKRNKESPDMVIEVICTVDIPTAGGGVLAGYVCRSIVPKIDKQYLADAAYIDTDWVDV